MLYKEICGIIIYVFIVKGISGEEFARTVCSGQTQSYLSKVSSWTVDSVQCTTLCYAFTLATKEIASVISSDPPSKNCNVRFTRVPFKSLQLSMITYELHIICFVNCTFLVQKKFINNHYTIYKTILKISFT